MIYHKLQRTSSHVHDQNWSRKSLRVFRLFSYRIEFAKISKAFVQFFRNALLAIHLTVSSEERFPDILTHNIKIFKRCRRIVDWSLFVNYSHGLLYQTLPVNTKNTISDIHRLVNDARL